jgi:flavodoxin
MNVIFFSGTGNTQHLSKLLAEKTNGKALSIENKNVRDFIIESNELAFAFPIYASNMPEIVRNFIDNTSDLWKNKKVFVFATCGMIYGQALNNAIGLFTKYEAEILGSEIFIMPDNIGDVLFITLALPVRKNQKKLMKSDNKMIELVEQIKNNNFPTSGLKAKPKPDIVKSTNNKPHIDESKCCHCNICKKVCPSPQKCTQCYRCYALCPNKAITILGDKARIQYIHKNFKQDS